MNAVDRTLLDTVRILETREVGSDTYEVCATARANYDEERRELSVEMDSFVRRVEMRGRDVVLRPEWLPSKDTVRTHIEIDEGLQAAREIFQSWVAKVSKRIPGPEEWNQRPAWLTDLSTSGKRTGPPPARQ